MSDALRLRRAGLSSGVPKHKRHHGGHKHPERPPQMVTVSGRDGVGSFERRGKQ